MSCGSRRDDQPEPCWSRTSILPQANSFPQNLRNASGALYFQGTTARTERTLEVGRDGRRDHVGQGHQSGRIRLLARRLTNVNGTLYFPANDGTNGNELWKTNGTAPER